MEKVSVELQPEVRTFLWVELGRKNIIAGHRGGKALAVVGLAHAVARIRRPRVEAVDEIEPGLVRHLGPQGVRLRLLHDMQAQFSAGMDDKSYRVRIAIPADT
mgnify:CR=1 FL=1